MAMAARAHTAASLSPDRTVFSCFCLVSRNVLYILVMSTCL